MPSPHALAHGRSTLIACLALLAALILAPAPSAEARVFILGVDGGSWNVIDSMLAKGELPHFAALMQRGVHADLETVEPVTSPVVWTSIATGRRPESHGVTDFFSTRLTIQTPTVFERLAARGHKVGLYDCLMTWPPVDLPNGFVIPGWLRRDDTVAPADVWSRIELTPFVNEYKKARTNGDYLVRAQRDVTEKLPRFLALTRAFDLDVAATTIYAVDMTSHRFWHGAYPDAFDPPVSAGSEAERTAVRDAVAGVDAALGELVAAMEPEDTVIVLSDHGFQTQEDGPANRWVTTIETEFARAGLDPERDGFSLVGTFGTVALRVHPAASDDVEAFRQRDAVLEKLLALLASYQAVDGDSLFATIESIDIAERPPELVRPWWVRLRQWVVENVVYYAFGVELDDSSHAIVFAMPNDGVMAPLWPDGKVRVGGRTAPLHEVASRNVFTGGHLETAIFLAGGGPVRHAPERGRLSVLDVASLVFYLAGEPVPDDLEGSLPTQILEPARLAAQPARSIAAAEMPGIASAGSSEAIEDPALVEKLRALGYVE